MEEEKTGIAPAPRRFIKTEQVSVKEQVLDDYYSGMSHKEIVAKYKIQSSTLYYWVNKSKGITDSHSNKVNTLKEIIYELLELI